tara:strand:+ start:9485 stop:9736 length:252 start_codon:yes stop_codon:yes gene_type:complete
MSFKKEPKSVKIFKNKRKKFDKHPDMIGTYIDKDGVEHDIALWTLTTRAGDYYYAGTCQNSAEVREKYKNNQSQTSDLDNLDI